MADRDAESGSIDETKAGLTAAHIPIPEAERSVLGMVTICVLVLLLMVLCIACGFLWTEADDARKRSQVAARLQVMKAEEEATRAKQELDVLREENQRLKAALAAAKKNAGE